MQCPTCHIIELLQAKSRSTGVTLDHCPQCRGVWCDRGEIERMLDVVVTGLRVPSDAAICARRCPICSERLHSFLYRGTHVTVDGCRSCTGIWLDGGELERIRQRRRFAAQHLGSIRERPDSSAGRQSPTQLGDETTFLGLRKSDHPFTLERRPFPFFLGFVVDIIDGFVDSIYPT
jgi:Zn-finger nucleic acid-binding protein